MTQSNPTVPVDQSAVVHARLDQIMAKLEAAETKAEERVEAVADLRKDMCDHFDTIEQNFKLLQGQFEVERQERQELEARVARTSTGAKKLSTSDAQQDATIGLIKAQVDALAETAKTHTELQQKSVALQQTIVDGAKKLSENRLVQLLVLVATYYAIQFLKKHGIEIQ